MGAAYGRREIAILQLPNLAKGAKVLWASIEIKERDSAEGLGGGSQLQHHVRLVRSQLKLVSQGCGGSIKPAALQKFQEVSLAGRWQGAIVGLVRG